MRAIPSSSQTNVRNIVDTSLQLGVNHFETARHYGTGDIQLGEALKRHGRDSFIVQMIVDPAGKKSDFVGNFMASLKALKLSYVDLFTFHGINNACLYGWLTKQDGGLDWADELKAKGYCRSIGFSTHGPCDLICRCIKTNRMDYVLLRWSFLDNSNREALVAAKVHDVGVSIISPNSQGGRLHNPPQKLVECCEPLHPMALNTLHCLMHHGIHALSIGVSSPGDFEFHIDTLKQRYGEYRVVQQVMNRIVSHINRVMGDRWYEDWDKGIPEWHELPGGINVKEILRLWTCAKCFDMYEYARSRYNLLEQGGHWHPGNTARQHELLSDSSEALFAGSSYGCSIPRMLEEAHQALDGPPVLRQSQTNLCLGTHHPD